MLRACKKCKLLKEDKDFYPVNGKDGRLRPRCKQCLRKDIRKWQKTERGSETLRRASTKAYENHKEKWVARAKARYAIIKGLIKKPKKCEVCEEIKPLQGHHEDYTKPLEVIFLCYSCHAEADILLRSKTPTHLI